MKTATDILFIAITIFLLLMFRTGAVRMFGSRRGNIFSLLVLLVLALQLILASQHVFEKTDVLPPRVLFTAMPWFILGFILLFSRKTKDLVKSLPQAALSGIQAYRIPVEIVLWSLFAQNIIPVQMSFEGLNFDIVSGILGGTVGLLLLRGVKLSQFLIIAWNVLGIALLFNIIIIALLSAPTPLRHFMNEPANTIITAVPYIWLPGFVAPMAFILHVLSIRKALAEMKG